MCDPPQPPPTSLGCLPCSSAQLPEGQCLGVWWGWEGWSCPWDSSPANTYRRQFPGDLLPRGRSTPLTSPGSVCQAQKLPWSRHLSGRRYSSFALATLPRSSRQGGRKMARPSSLIGGCNTMVPSLWEKAGSSSYLPSPVCAESPLGEAPLAIPGRLGALRAVGAVWSSLVTWVAEDSQSPQEPRDMPLLHPSGTSYSQMAPSSSAP